MQNSPWEVRSENLRAFMNTIRASGGSGPGEAVEIGLWHANFEALKGGVS